MIGPVLYLEMLLGGWRFRQLLFRYLYAGWLVLQFSILYCAYWLDNVAGPSSPDPEAASRFATAFVELFLRQQFILILLVTPAFVAGAITDEKTRGTLQYMLTAHLTAREIVLGKLLGRLSQVGVLFLTGLPLLCFVGVFGGLHPAVLLTFLALTLVLMFSLGAASMLASVWGRQTRDAVLGLYGFLLAGWLLVLGLDALARSLASGVAVGNSPGVLGALVFRL